MKKHLEHYSLILTIFFVSTLMVIIGCNVPENRTAMGEMLHGNHQITKVEMAAADTSVKVNQFFAIKKGKDCLMVLFSWEMNDSSYVISELPLSKIRFKYDPMVDQPSIKFRWTGGQTKDLKTIFENDIVYAIVTCKEEDFNFNIPVTSEK